jgi:error-prone DNA polymerase
VSVTGKLQNEFGVIHVIAEHLDDLTSLLKRLAEDTGCVEALAKADQVKHGIPDWQPPPRPLTPPLIEMASERTDVPAVKVRAVMPKGRNFR